MKVVLFINLVVLFSFNAMAADLKKAIQQIEQTTNGDVGVAVPDTRTGQQWNYKGQQRFPMMSPFKTRSPVQASFRCAGGTAVTDR